MRSFYLFLIIAISWFTAIGQPSFSISTNELFCGNTKIIFNARCVGDANGISLVHVHEDETTAVKAANWLLDSTNGLCFVTWQCQQTRNIQFELGNIQYQFDPNRIFTKQGIKTTLKNSGNFSDSALNKVNDVANAFKEKYIQDQKMVVALHNNTNAGALSINSYKKGAIFGKDAAAIYVNKKKDADDFFLTTQLSFFTLLKQKGYNVVLQDNENVKDDGSLSVYCGKNGIPYINIEAEKGHLKEQKQMLKVVWQILQMNN